MPRVRIIEMPDGKVQVAVLANKPRELPSRMAVLKDDEKPGTAVRRLVTEWKQERDNREAGQ